MSQRLTVAVLGLALLSSWSHVAPLHIHAYSDHDHPEHHHGPAAHEHERPARAEPDAHELERQKDCDPGEHVSSIAFVSTAATSTTTAPVETAAPFVLTPDAVRVGRTDVTDVRAHGPPALAQSSPRAPPASLSA